MNALKLLTADHKDVERMFKKAEKARGAEKRDLFFSIKAALEAHAWIEETIFYPTLQGEGKDELMDLTSEAIKEHIDMKCLLGEISVVSTNTQKFESLLTKLINDVRRHVQEEEGEMFPAIEEVISANALDVVGSSMEAEKKRFLESAETIYG